ncbi:MAG: hypothetical protein M0R05_03910 [Bacilli bacterium]|nr:hypothetical protein [Bacilli bacterium]MDD4077048.1 hypothetical protein [Bacilli bacterium]
MKNKKLIIVLSILLLAIIGLMTNLIVAWLTDTAKTGPTDFTLGQVSFAWSGAITTELVVPGENIVTSEYKLTNSSTIPTELRVKIDINSAYLAGDGSEYVVLAISDGWVLDNDDYYYYRGIDTVSEGEAPDIKYKIPTTVTTISVLTEVILDGAKVGNVFGGTEFTITFTFEAKQNDFVDWATLGTSNIDFSTGLPTP